MWGPHTVRTRPSLHPVPFLRTGRNELFSPNAKHLPPASHLPGVHMATIASPPPDTEPPECPVCLSPFDAGAAAPRVLPCGHSLCGPCISSLPPASASASASSLRCPLCSQVVPFSRSLGPSSLPKNLALLSFLPSNPTPTPTPTRTPHPTSTSTPLPLPLPSAHSRLLSRFRHAILPHTASPLHETPSPGGDRRLALGSIAADLGPPWFCARGHSVSLLPIEVAGWKPKPEAAFYRPSYASQVAAAVNALSNAVRDEFGAVVEVSARAARRVCRVYGVWMDPELPPLWLVSERHQTGIDGLVKERSGILEGGEGAVAWIGAIGMELCEAIMGLHAEGLVLGCFGLNCFCLDCFGHCLLDLNQALMLCRTVRRVGSSKAGAFVAPEVLAMLREKKTHDFDGLIGCSSDVWSLGCVLVALFTDNEQLMEGCIDGLYGDWKKEVIARLEASLVGAQLEPLLTIAESCLSYHPDDRPNVVDVWRCIKGSLMKSSDGLAPDEDLAAGKSFRCLLLGELCSMCSDSTAVESDGEMYISQRVSHKSTILAGESNGGCAQSEEVDAAGLDEPLSRGLFRSITLQAHRDCVTGLAIGGGLLFSSSYDKTINVWSLQDFSHVQSLKGHEHKIMAIVVVDNDNDPLCISGDSGSGIFVWSVDSSIKQEPLKKWYEHNDWLYRGVHCLAVSGTGYLYTGSRDKSIKAWSLQDYSLCCTMTGHKSTVSAIAVASGILYSGSWDGTIRSWWLTDHSPLTVLEDNTLGNIAPVLSLSTETNFVVSSYENGYLKMWKDDVLVRSEKLQNGAIYAVKMDGKWLYTGGWDKVINIQELSENESETEIRDVACVTCDSIVTSILYWQGRLIVGLSNREIKVYYM